MHKTLFQKQKQNKTKRNRAGERRGKERTFALWSKYLRVPSSTLFLTLLSVWDRGHWGTSDQKV